MANKKINDLTLAVGAADDMQFETDTNGLVANKINVQQLSNKILSTDLQFSATLPNAIQTTNATADGLNETTTTLTEPAANQFKLTNGTTDLTVQSDCTVDQDLSTTSDVNFNSVTSTTSVDADTLSATSSITLSNSVDEFSTDGTLSDNSDSVLPTEKAVKTYVDTIGWRNYAQKKTRFYLDQPYTVALTTSGATDLQTAINGLSNGNILEIQTDATYDPITIPSSKEFAIRVKNGYDVQISGQNCITLSNGSSKVFISGLIIDSPTTSDANGKGSAICMEHQAIINEIIFENVTIRNANSSAILLSYHQSIGGDFYYTPNDPSEFSEKIAFLNCTLDKCTTDGTEGASAVLRGFNQPYFGNNFINIRSTGGRGIMLQNCTDSYVFKNKILNGNLSNGEGIKIDRIGSPSYNSSCFIYGNIIKNCIEGIDVDDYVNSILYNNICYLCGDEGISLDGDSTAVMVNNICFNNTDGIRLESGSVANLKGNVCFNNSSNNFRIENGYTPDASNTTDLSDTFLSSLDIPYDNSSSTLTNTILNDVIDELDLADQRIAGSGVTYGHINDSAQTIAGSKTFSDKASYSSHPTFSSDTELVDKKYVDDSIVGGVNEDQIYYVGKHGNDTSGDGRNIEHAFLTFQKGITTSEAQTPSSANRFTVKCNDSGQYVEDLTLSDNFVNIDGKNAYVQGKLSILHTIDGLANINLFRLTNTSDDALYINTSNIQQIDVAINNLERYVSGNAINIDCGSQVTLNIKTEVITGPIQVDGTISNCYISAGYKYGDITVKTGATLHVDFKVLSNCTLNVESGATLYIRVDKKISVTEAFDPAATIVWVTPSSELDEQWDYVNTLDQDVATTSDVTFNSATLTTALDESYGGTGKSTYTDGQLLIGKTDGSLGKNTLTAGSGITITNGDGSIEIENTGSVGLDQDQIIYWRENGNDSLSGQSIEHAVSSLAIAQSKGSALSPSSTNIVTLKCFDAGRYGSWTLHTDPYMYIDAPMANTVLGTCTLGSNNKVIYGSVSLTSSVAVYKQDSGNSFLKINYIKGGAAIRTNEGILTAIVDTIDTVTPATDNIIDVQNGSTLYLKLRKGNGLLTVNSGGTAYINLSTLQDTSIDFKDGSTAYINIDYVPSSSTITIPAGVIGSMNIAYDDGATITNNSDKFKINILSDVNRNTKFGTQSNGYFKVSGSLQADGSSGIVSTKQLEVDGDTLIQGQTKIFDSSGNLKVDLNPNGSSKISSSIQPYDSKADTTYAILSTDSGKLFDNTGATGNTTFTLPLLSGLKDGMYFEFLVKVGQQITINTQSTDYIYYLDKTDINQFRSSLQTSYIVICVTNGVYSVKQIAGEWDYNEFAGGINYTNTIDGYSSWINQGASKYPTSNEDHISMYRNNIVINGYYDRQANLFKSSNSTVNYNIWEDSDDLKISYQTGASVGSTLDGSWNDAIAIDSGGISLLEYTKTRVINVTSSSTRVINKIDIGAMLVYNSSSNGLFRFNNTGSSNIPIGAYGYFCQINTGEIQIDYAGVQIVQALVWNSTSQQFESWVPAGADLYTINNGSVVRWQKIGTNRFIVSGNLTAV